MNVRLEWDDRHLLVELLNDHRDAVASGEVSGYSDTREGRLAHVDRLISELED